MQQGHHKDWCTNAKKKEERGAQTFCHFLFSLMSKVWEKGKTCCPFQQRTQEENNAEILWKNPTQKNRRIKATFWLSENRREKGEAEKKFTLEVSAKKCPPFACLASFLLLESLTIGASIDMVNRLCSLLTIRFTLNFLAKQTEPFILHTVFNPMSTFQDVRLYWVPNS